MSEQQRASWLLLLLLQAACGMRLFYRSGEQGTSSTTVDVGRPGEGRLMGECHFTANDVIASGQLGSSSRCRMLSRCALTMCFEV